MGNITYGFAIEGMGDKSTGNQYMLVPTELGFSLSGYTFATVLADLPGVVSQDIEWPGGIATQSSITLDLCWFTEYPDLVDFLYASRPKPFGLLDTNQSATATASKFELVSGQTMVSADDYVYMQREVLKINTVGATGDSDSDGKDETTISSMSRAQFGSRALPINGTKVYNDRYLYTRNPIVEGRRVEGYRIDLDAQTKTLFFTGVLEKPSEEDLGCTLKLPCRNTLAYTQGKKLGVERLYAWGSPNRWGQNYQVSNVETDERSKPFPTPIGSDSSERWVVMRFGQMIAPMRAVFLDSNEGGYWQLLDVVGGDAIYKDPSLQDRSQGNSDMPKPVRGWEVLITGDSTYNYFVDSAGSVSTHISDIIRCILCSTGSMTWAGGTRTLGPNGDFDALPLAWGLGVPDDYIDHDSFEEMKLLSPYDELFMENLVLGNDEEPKDAGEVLNELLQSCGLFLVLGSSGKVELKTLYDDGRKAETTLDYESMCIEGSYSRAHSEWPPMQNFTLKGFRRWPGNSHQSFMLHTDLLGVRPQRYEGIVSDQDISGDHFGTPGRRTWKSGVSRCLRQVFRQYYWLRSEPLPTYDVEIDLEQVDVGLLDLVVFTCPAAIDADTATRGITDHVCIVLSSSEDTKNATSSVRLLDLHYLMRSRKVIAPAFYITSATSQTNFVIQQYWCVENGDPILVSDWELLDTIWNDEFANVGLYDSLGNQRGIFGEVQSFSRATGAVQLGGVGFSVTPNAGDYMRIATYGSASSGARSSYSFIADKDAGLGSSPNPADEWGV